MISVPTCVRYEMKSVYVSEAHVVCSGPSVLSSFGVFGGAVCSAVNTAQITRGPPSNHGKHLSPIRTSNQPHTAFSKSSRTSNSNSCWRRQKAKGAPRLIVCSFPKAKFDWDGAGLFCPMYCVVSFIAGQTFGMLPNSKDFNIAAKMMMMPQEPCAATHIISADSVVQV